jgi:threonine dehydrogenase-like Zn-dependent dehydrogenase
MKTTAVRLYGAMDLRMETFELPEIGHDGVRVEVVSDSICMSSYKAAVQGTAHKRVPKDAAEHPVIIGHEFCGKIIEVGKNWQAKYRAGEHVAIQPAHFYQGSLLAPGYSYQFCGGAATVVNIPIEILKMDCLLPYASDTFFYGSLAEPMSCIIGTFHGMYHTSLGSYEHRMGIVEGGKLALLASVGPMGLGAIDYALHGERKPGLLVVTDIDDQRLARAKSIYTVEHAKSLGVELVYVNTAKLEDPVAALKALTGGTGFDDAICFAPVKPVVEQADSILGFDGCLSFFAGPTNTAFKAEVNFYDVHYSSHHILGTTGGNTDDMREAISLMTAGKINPAAMITHIGGLNSAAETTLNLPNIPGGKKLIYTHLDMPLTAIADFAERGKTEPMFAELDRIVKGYSGLWCGEAEAFLLQFAKRIDRTRSQEK